MNAALSRTHRIRIGFSNLRSIFLDIQQLKEESGGHLSEMLGYIAKKAGMALQVLPEACECLGKSSENGLPEAGHYSLEEILNLLLHGRHLDYTLKEGLLEINLIREETSPRLESYDVSDLIQIAVEQQFDFSSHENLWESRDSSANYEVFGVNFEEILENPNEFYYTESSIIHLIEENVYKNSFNHFPRTMITSSPGKLYISHLPHVHQSIRKFLDELRLLARVPVTIETTFIICKNSFFKQMGIEFLPIYSEENSFRTMALWSKLSKDQEQRMFETVEHSKDAFCIKKEPIELLHLETSHIIHASKTEFLAGYDVASQKDKLGRIYDGVIAKVKPTVNLEKKEVRLDLTIDVAVVNKPIASIPVERGEIAIPMQLTQHLSTAISIPDSQGVLLAGFANPYEDEGDRSLSPIRKKDQLLFYIKLKLNT